MSDTIDPSLYDRRQQLARQLADIGEFRPGSLTSRFQKCNKPNCHCAKPGARGHGPSWFLTRGVKGRVVCRSIAKDQLDITREQVERYRQFRVLVDEFIEVNEQLCHAQLKQAREAQKGALNKASAVS